MADKETKEEKNVKSKKKGFNFKIILIGLPLFIVQLVLVYFITVTFLVDVSSVEGKNKEHTEETAEEEEDEEGEHAPQHIFSIDDLIINPAGTNGQRLLLLSIGFGSTSEEGLNLLKENEVIIKDIIISTVSRKNLRTLSQIELKDSLKVELAHKVNDVYPEADIKNVYFSKYLIN
ncbi:MAG: flagellar basal body protein FliL [Ignavibacteriae bacterium]|nr:MAG: flagellar basal body protein FliL [Ignavibacteriota bacterium]